jgi:choline dehydrogenase-like flavoprotein
MPGFEDKYYYGKNPTVSMIANFRNLGTQDTDFIGGYTVFCGAMRDRPAPADIEGPHIGADFKHRMSRPGQWVAYMYMQGETIPKESNRVYLSSTEKDPYGIPQLVTEVDYDDNDEKMIRDYRKESEDMLRKAGCENVQSFDNGQAPGLDIHEMGGVRMGDDPEAALLNKFNQLHHCKNVFVTDGACMTSTGNQSPSILYMALTARAADYAAAQFKSGNL